MPRSIGVPSNTALREIGVYRPLDARFHEHSVMTGCACLAARAWHPWRRVPGTRAARVWHRRVWHRSVDIEVDSDKQGR